jgi:DNA-binding transcriptional regulator GbsR (MarR family)
MRALERLGMVHKQILLGERKDYYVAETDLWAIVKGILREREKSEFDHAIRSVSETLELVRNGDYSPEQASRAAFYEKCLTTIARFFRTLDDLVATILALDEIRIGALEKLIGLGKDSEE